MFSVDLWLITLKYLIESISSPQNSILTPIFSVIDISTIPPLTLNCPFPSIRSYLLYPRFMSLCFISSILYWSPIFSFILFLYRAFLLIIFCITASIVVTTITFLFSFILFSISILSYCNSLLSAT